MKLQWAAQICTYSLFFFASIKLLYLFTFNYHYLLLWFLYMEDFMESVLFLCTYMGPGDQTWVTWLAW